VETMIGRMYCEVLQPVATGMLTGSAYFNLNPYMTFGSPTGGTATVSGDNKFAAMSQQFQLFRFTKVRMRIIPSTLAVTSVEVAGSWNVCAGWQYFGGSNPVSFSGALQLPWCTETVAQNADGGTLPSVPKWYTVPRSALTQGPFRWFKCFGTSAVVPTGETQEQYFQGTLWIAGKCAPVSASAYMTYGFDLEVTVQFKDWMPTTGVTYEERRITGLWSDTNRSVEMYLSKLDADEKGVILLDPAEVDRKRRDTRADTGAFRPQKANGSLTAPSLAGDDDEKEDDTESGVEVDVTDPYTGHDVGMPRDAL